MKPEIRKFSTAVIITLFVVVLVLGWLRIEPVGAQTSPLLNFIGKVTNLDGTEIADGAYDFTFRLFVVPSGGTPTWSETSTAATRFSATVSAASTTASGMVYSYSSPSATSTLRVGQYLSSASSTAGALIVDYNIGANTITVASSSETWSVGADINNRPFVEGGIINENLGVITDISSVDFSQTLYLEIIFNGETMSPRKLLTTVPAAFDTIRLGGKTESEYATLAEDETITGEWSFNNIVSISTSSSNTALTVTQSGTGNIVEFKVGTTTSFAVLNDGRVQIGNYYFPTTYGAPGYVLKTDASGNLYWDPDFAGGFGDSGLDFLWATNTAETLIRPVDTADVVVIGNVATSTFAGNIFEVHGSSLFDTVNISNQQELRLYDLDSSNYIAWRASSSISSNLVLTLPDSYGAPNLALITDGAGNLSWGSPPSFVYVNPGTIGQMAYYASAGSALSATSSIYLSDQGYFGVGTTSPSQLLSVGGISGSQFLVNNSGQIVAGTWQGDVINVAFGGTGLSSIANQSLLYASSNNIINEFTIGADGTVLAVVSGQLAWATTSAPTAHSILSVSHSGVDATSTLVRGDLMVANSSSLWSRLGLGANGYILYSNGSDAIWSTTTVITALGIITSGTWQAGIIDIAYGGTGASTATGTRVNLGLDDIARFGVNSTGTDGWLWQSDGDGRGQWVATGTLGLVGSGSETYAKLIGTTSAEYDGGYATTSLIGYAAANAICAAEFNNSFMCRTYDILVSIEQDDISQWSGSAWIAEGPPGYTSNSNDCKGWTSSSTIMLGAFWVLDSNGGGVGWLTNCSETKPIACCLEQ